MTDARELANSINKLAASGKFFDNGEIMDSFISDFIPDHIAPDSKSRLDTATLSPEKRDMLLLGLILGCVGDSAMTQRTKQVANVTEQRKTTFLCAVLLSALRLGKFIER